MQDRLADLFAKYSWNKCLFMIISTHSYPFISKFPADGVCALLMAGKNVAKSSRGKTEILSQKMR